VNDRVRLACGFHSLRDGVKSMLFPLFTNIPCKALFVEALRISKKRIGKRVGRKA
jgi:hypothetical protein